MRRNATGLLIVVLLAAIGYLLVVLPGELIARYQEARQLSPTWGYLYLGIVGVGCLILTVLTIAIAFRLWRNTRERKQKIERRRKDPSELSHAEQQAELKDNLNTSRDFAEGSEVSADVRKAISDEIERVETRLTGDKLEIVAFGTISSGKSSLLNALAGRDVFQSDVRGGTTTVRSDIPWPGDDRVTLVDTPGLAEVEGEERAALSARVAQDADLVLFVVDGPLKSYEISLLRQLAAMEKRILICLNKEDWYEAADRDELLGQIAAQSGNLVERDDVVAVRARPASRRRVRVLADGSETDEAVPLEPDIRPLATRLLEVVQRDGVSLLLANLLLQSRGLVEESKDRVREALDRRAEEIISRYMWAAGGLAAANPLPLVDMIGGAAVSGKMVLELAKVYRQSITADALAQMLAQLTKNLVGMLGVAAVTPALASVVGSLLKTVPGVGTIAGGIVQGVVQALLTRWIGRVFKVYFRDEMKLGEAGVAELARRQWDDLTKPEELLKLIQAGRRKLLGSEEPQ